MFRPPTLPVPSEIELTLLLLHCSVRFHVAATNVNYLMMRVCVTVRHSLLHQQCSVFH